jgi:hypothetical protein
MNTACRSWPLALCRSAPLDVEQDPVSGAAFGEIKRINAAGGWYIGCAVIALAMIGLRFRCSRRLVLWFGIMPHSGVLRIQLDDLFLRPRQGGCNEGQVICASRVGVDRCAARVCVASISPVVPRRCGWMRRLRDSVVGFYRAGKPWYPRWQCAVVFRSMCHPVGLHRVASDDEAAAFADSTPRTPHPSP